MLTVLFLFFNYDDYDDTLSVNLSLNEKGNIIRIYKINIFNINFLNLKRENLKQ